MPVNLPNLLTLLRILLLPALVVVFYLPFEWSRPACGWIFLLGALTDIFDGFLARRLQQVSAFGRFLDPVADKLQVALALILLVDADPVFYVTLPAIIIIGREITISALREWMAEIGSRTQVAVSDLGKIKTVVQMTALTLMLYNDDLFGVVRTYPIGLGCLWAATVLTAWSLWQYLQAAWPSLRQS